MLIPLGNNVKILKKNSVGLYALEKPEGILSHPNEKTDISTCLINAAYNAKEQFYYWLDEANNKQKCYLLNRLDSPTSGVILVSTDSKVAQIVKDLFRENKVEKTYYAIIRGVPKIPKGLWKDALSRSKVNKTLRVKAGEGNKALTFYTLQEISKSSPKVSLVELCPKTGKTHQLRVHSAKNRHPIVGDKTYGDFLFNKNMKQIKDANRLYLHASKVVLEFKLGAKKMNFSAKSELPQSFIDILS